MQPPWPSKAQRTSCDSRTLYPVLDQKRSGLWGSKEGKLLEKGLELLCLAEGGLTALHVHHHEGPGETVAGMDGHATCLGPIRHDRGAVSGQEVVRHAAWGAAIGVGFQNHTRLCPRIHRETNSGANVSHPEKGSSSGCWGSNNGAVESEEAGVNIPRCSRRWANVVFRMIK
ncbi:hypothetical protein E2C01_068709 [Portunus trituberculatus]|uniref:Uncharacterized protein n=1 Tax=Portunus trituberculatus TaxID=210409 RepID=A0A5B7HX63_PORTR|nr:hypothetical protein [Portunus trituberculatus]